MPSLTLRVGGMLTLGFAAICPADGATMTYFDESDWLAAVSGASVEGLAFTPLNIDLADEVSSPPPDEQGLGQVLNWDRTNTGLSFDFSFHNQSPTSGSQIVFRNNPDRLNPNPTADHDWGLRLSGPATFNAIGFTTHGAESPGDAFEARDSAGNLLALVDPPDFPHTDVFVGIVVDDPIAQLNYLDNDLTGGRAILDFQVAPEPATLALVVLGIAGLGIARNSRQRSGSA